MNKNSLLINELKPETILQAGITQKTALVNQERRINFQRQEGGSNENHAPLETLKHLPQHFSSVFLALCCLKIFLLKR